MYHVLKKAVEEYFYFEQSQVCFRLQNNENGVLFTNLSYCAEVWGNTYTSNIMCYSFTSTHEEEPIQDIPENRLTPEEIPETRRRSCSEAL